MRTIRIRGDEYQVLSDIDVKIDRPFLAITGFRISEFGSFAEIVDVKYYYTDGVTEVHKIPLGSNEVDTIKNGLVAATTKTASKEINDIYSVPQGGQEYEQVV